MKDEPADEVTARASSLRGLLLAGGSIASVYAVWLAVASPRGAFPLNDDWAYAWSVQRMLKDGVLRISQWTSATAVFQVYWGALFSTLAGQFSFTALRWSTLVMSLVGLIALYDLLRQLDVDRRSAWLGCMALTVNPLYVHLSYTFMSDVFYFAPMLLSLGFYVRGVKRSSLSALTVGACLASVAYLSRQLGVLLPIAAAIALLLRDRRVRFWPLACATVLPAFTFLIHAIWLTHLHGVPWGFEVNVAGNSVRALFRPIAPFEIARRLVVSLLYLGIFTLPVLAAVGPGLWRERDRRPRLVSSFLTWLVVLGPLVATFSIVTGHPMPYLANIINRDGIGALTLLGRKPPITPAWVFWVVTICAPVAGAAQATLWTNAARELRGNGPSAVLFIASVLMAIATALIVVLWDQYLLVFIPAGLYLVLQLRPITKRDAWIGVGVCALMFVYGAREMADYMAWNAARWSAGRQLVADGVAPAEIDGGFEWVGWHEFETALPVAIAQGHRNDLFAWMHVTPVRYHLAFSPVVGYAVVRSVPYDAGPLAGVRELYVLAPALK